MNTLFQKYKNLCVDGSLISLADGDLSEPYFCYPTNAKIVGFEGCILYCFIDGYDEMVFASNPKVVRIKMYIPLQRAFRTLCD